MSVFAMSSAGGRLANACDRTVWTVPPNYIHTWGDRFKMCGVHTEQVAAQVVNHLICANCNPAIHQCETMRSGVIELAIPIR